MSKFQMAADGPISKAKHKYEIVVEGSELRIHATMPLKSFVNQLRAIEGIDICGLIGTYQIKVVVGRLFSVETTENRLKVIMDEIITPKIAKEKTKVVKKKNTKGINKGISALSTISREYISQFDEVLENEINNDPGYDWFEMNEELPPPVQRANRNRRRGRS